MKNFLALCLCIAMSFSLTGCSLGTLIAQISDTQEKDAQEVIPDKPRVYMDEVKGTLLDFTGDQLTIQSYEDSYVFDVSQATLECADGMIAGDEISVIYEGLLDSTDTSAVKALKVVDEYHSKTVLEDQVIQGQVQALTPNTITLKTADGKTAVFPITGTKQYYQGGISAGINVFLHYKGMFPDSTSSDTVLDASHLKVLSISDGDPFTVPAPTPSPAEGQSVSQSREMYVVIENVNLNVLTAVVSGSNTSLTLDMSAVPSYFPGGCAPGSKATISYTGEFNGTTAEGITLRNITGHDPAGMKEHNITCTVSGVIMSSTANTFTMQTNDGAVITCRSDGASDSSTGGLASGTSVCVTFNPAASQNSNIYSCLKIEDA